MSDHYAREEFARYADPLRADGTDDEPFTLAPRLKVSGSSVGCVLLLLAVALGAVAGYLLRPVFEGVIR